MAYEPLVREADPEVRRYVKAADKLAAWLKCQEELKAGNAEFRRAADETLTTLAGYGHGGSGLVSGPAGRGVPTDAGRFGVARGRTHPHCRPA